MQIENKYDYIIAGAGCAGYSLLYHLLQDPFLCKKKILVVDTNFNKGNDRTWCFWEDTDGPFESIVCKKWSNIEVLKGRMQRLLPTAPFEYKMIQGIDFYQYISAFAKGFDNVEWIASKILSIDAADVGARVNWEGGAANANYVFSSINGERIQSTLWQHFKGNVVEFDDAVFDKSVARLMDFNVPQMDATAFMYLLPLTDKKALVEYTLFSPNILETAEYDLVLNAYMEAHYKGQAYSIVHTEQGAIPMTTKKMTSTINNVISIGTMGDAVKASTGYAFQFIQKQTQQIVKQLKLNQTLDASVHYTRHQFYDAVLLYILEHKKMEGDEIFARIFKKNDAATVFKFLSNTSNLIEDIRIMLSLPTQIFLTAAIKVLFRR
ncbi:MAG: lycopene cyclase [Chitinophagia bacterium]|nr:lycopene cyclase [Chitinophagia bacterium]